METENINEKETAPEEQKEISTAAYWLRFVKAAKEAAKDHWDVSRRAWNEYLKKTPEISSASASQKQTQPPERVALFWASIKNLQPAYYARTPETVARRMFDSDDPIARTACLLAERLSKYLLSVYPIDTAMVSAVLDFLITDKATTRLFYEEEYQENPVVKQLYLTPKGYVDEKGVPVKLEKPIQPDANGLYFAEDIEKTIIKVCPHIIPVSYYDIIHTPSAKTFQEIKEMGFKLWLNRHEFREMFGAEKTAAVSFNIKSDPDGKEPTGNKGKDGAEQSKFNEGIEVWEIWDKRDKKVRWVTETYRDGFLKEIDDPYNLLNFFPCPEFVLGTKPPGSLYPTPMYKQLESVIDQIHRVFTRITKLTLALRRRGIADAALKDVIDSINALEETEIYLSSKYQQLVEEKMKGVDPIWYLPLQELVEALSEAQGLYESFKSMFFELSGVPDVVRGVTDAQETAAAQQEKSNFFNVRTCWDQHLIQKLARDTIEMQMDVALAKMPDALFFEVVGLDYLSEENKQYAADALKLLRSDRGRSIRIEIETDSLTFQGDQAKTAKREKLISDIMQGFASISGLQNPNYIKPGFNLLMLAIRGIDLGKAYEEEIKMVAQQVIEASQQPPPSPPPPPDHEAEKIQLQAQKQQMDAQLGFAKLETEKLKLSQDAWKVQMDNYFKEQAANFEASMQERLVMLDEREQEFKELMAGEYLQLDTYKVELDEKEKFLEEQRLALDGFNETQAAEAKQMETKSKEPATSITIVNAPEAPKPDITPILPVIE